MGSVAGDEDVDAGADVGRRIEFGAHLRAAEEQCVVDRFADDQEGEMLSGQLWVWRVQEAPVVQLTKPSASAARVRVGAWS